MVTISKEDYIKEIYLLALNAGEKISTTFLAERLNVSNAAVSDMAKKLDNAGLVSYEKYKGVKLTAKGKSLALKIIRRHRLWESFLVSTLNLSWNEVHDEAEKLEHQTSEFLIDKIDDFLGNPEFDPHGDPIPNKKGVLPKAPDTISLVRAEIGSEYVVSRVEHHNRELMDYFTAIGIELLKEIKVIKKLEFDNSIFAKIDNNEINFSERVASKIFVSLKKDTDNE